MYVSYLHTFTVCTINVVLLYSTSHIKNYQCFFMYDSILSSMLCSKPVSLYMKNVAESITLHLRCHTRPQPVYDIETAKAHVCQR